MALTCIWSPIPISKMGGGWKGSPGADGRWHIKAGAEDLKGLKPADCASVGGGDSIVKK